MSKLISIIVPVYNVEKYLCDCVNSVIAQTYHDWELLLIDDGSTDKSGTICDEYAATNDKIHVFHKHNGGVSSARNVGLDNAKGEYITFADSDDFLEPDAFQVYIEAFSKYNVDIVRTGFFHEHEDGIIERTCISVDEVFNSTWSLFKRTEETKYYSFLWNSCLKRSCIEGIFFNEALNWLEDHTFIYRCYLNSKSYALLAMPTYHYVRHDNTSLAHVKDPTMIFCAAEEELKLKLQLIDRHDDIQQEQVQDLYRYRINDMVNILYKNVYPFEYRRNLSSNQTLISSFLYKEEKIFFNNNYPFILRDIVLHLLFFVKQMWIVFSQIL